MRKAIGAAIIVVFGILVFLSLTGLITGIFGGDHRVALFSAVSLGILLLAKKNITLIIGRFIKKK